MHSKPSFLTHTHKILALSQFFAGATNDKSIAQYNVAIQHIHTKNKLLTDLEWGAFDGNGNEKRQKGDNIFVTGDIIFGRSSLLHTKCKLWGVKWSNGAKIWSRQGRMSNVPLAF